MRKGPFAWGTLLALSLGFNAYLWIARPSATTATTDRLSARSPTRRVARVRAPADSVALADRAGYATLDRITIEQRLVQAEARVESLRRPDERFAMATKRDMHAEGTIEPYLAEVFELQAGADRPYSVECRERVCKIEADQENAWMSRLQSLPGRLRFGEMMFARQDTYVIVLSTEEYATNIPDAIRERFAFSEAAEACIHASSDSGDLTLTISFDQRARQFAISMGGSLVSHRVAGCLHDVLAEICRSFDVHHDVTPIATTSIRLQLPIEDE